MVTYSIPGCNRTEVLDRIQTW